MSVLQKFSCLIPETSHVTGMKVVRSNYPLLDRDGRLQRTLEFTDGTACSINVPKGNEAIMKAIASVHSGDSFRIAYKGEALAREKQDQPVTTPSGAAVPGTGYKVRSWYQSPIIVWDTYLKQEVGALYKDAVLPDFSDREPTRITVLPAKTAPTASNADMGNDQKAF